MATYWAKDKTHVYFKDQIYNEADVSTFHADIFTNKYHCFIVKDENHMFFNSEIVEGADPATFEILSSHLAKDAKYSYSFDEKRKFIRY